MNDTCEQASEKEHGEHTFRGEYECKERVCVCACVCGGGGGGVLQYLFKVRELSWNQCRVLLCSVLRKEKEMERWRDGEMEMDGGGWMTKRVMKD